MKVIKKERTPIKNPEYPKRIICDNCGAELEIDEADVHIGCYGLEYVTCPECDKKTAVNDCRSMPPTFPTTFYHFEEGVDTKVLTDEETQNLVDEIAKYKDKLKPCEFVSTSAGDTKVFAEKFEDDFVITVAKNYWEDSIYEEDR